MAEKPTLNPMLQILAVQPTRQGAASLSGNGTPAQAPNAANSFSQELKSASQRISDAGASKQPDNATPDPQIKPTTAPAPAERADTPPPDAAALATRAFLAQQGAAGKTVPDLPARPTTQAGLTTDEIERLATNPDPAAAAQALALALPATAQIAAPAAVTSEEPAAPPAILADRETPLIQTASPAIAGLAPTPNPVQSSASDAADSGQGPSFGTATVMAQTGGGQMPTDQAGETDKELLNGQRGQIDAAMLQGREGKAEASANTLTSPFAAELSNAQAAYGIKADARLDTPPSPTQYTVNTPVNARNWADEVGARVSWIANKDSGRADLVLTPAHMGKIEVSINLNGDQASATFTAANASTRDALQDALPRLREILADAGIQLGQASVNAGNGGQAQADQQPTRAGMSYAGGPDGTAEITAESGEKRAPRSQGLVDLFA